MLQNLPKGETDKSYNKTINVRELKTFFKHLFRVISDTFCMDTEM